MLGYLLRTMPLAVRARAARDGARVVRLPRRVRLRQIDLNLHMNQAAYAEVMELGRTAWIMRSGAWSRWRARGVNPVVAAQRIVYRRELAPLQRFVVDTRATGFEGRLLRVEHHLLVGEQVHATNALDLIFVGPDGVLAAPEVHELARDLVVPALRVRDWRVVDDPAADEASRGAA
jgi:acyl-CoA thioesterase FadM